MAVAMLVSYQRAKAESLGFDAKGGLMERAERFIVLGFGLLFSELLIGVLWGMLVLTAIPAVQRFVKVWRQASGRPLPTPARERLMERRLAMRSTMSWGWIGPVAAVRWSASTSSTRRGCLYAASRSRQCARSASTSTSRSPPCPPTTTAQPGTAASWPTPS